VRALRLVAVSACFALVAVTDVGMASGQDRGDPSTDRLAVADSLARSGRAEEARELLVAWWDGERADAARAELEHATWLRALLTVDPDQARIEYRRLVVEFPGGRYVAPSLARIALLLAAAGDTAGARESWESLRREYPGSEESARAEAWLEEAEGG
jgi:hypothetical protein